jgi:hypothetical protein
VARALDVTATWLGCGARRAAAIGGDAQPDQRGYRLTPSSQREVVTLRDSEGWTTEEVCNILQITETNQRVLLHRGRSRVRRALEQYLTGT